MVHIHRYFLYVDAWWRQLKTFLNSLNEFDPCIKFTCESNKESIAFLDIKVSLRNGKVFTILHIKPTDRHLYLHYLSAHPYHTKKSVVFCQTKQISKLCSSEKNFEDHKEEIKLWFRKREHPENLIRCEMNKVKFSNLRPKSNDKNHNMKGIPLVVTYHPLLKSQSGFTDKNLSHLYMDKEVKKYLPHNPWFHFVGLKFIFFNWNSLHSRLNSRYKAWSYKKKKHKRLQHTGNLFWRNLLLIGIC